MITVTIHRKTLERLGACAEGLALYDQIAASQPESDDRTDCIKIADWTPLHSIWPYVAGYGAFARWLEARGIIPRADLSGATLSGATLSGGDLSGANLSRANLSGADLSCANLYGAYRGSHSEPIPGWRTNEFGFLEREGVTRAAD